MGNIVPLNTQNINNFTQLINNLTTEIEAIKLNQNTNAKNLAAKSSEQGIELLKKDISRYETLIESTQSSSLGELSMAGAALYKAAKGNQNSIYYTSLDVILQYYEKNIILLMEKIQFNQLIIEYYEDMVEKNKEEKIRLSQAKLDSVTLQLVKKKLEDEVNQQNQQYQSTVQAIENMNKNQINQITLQLVEEKLKANEQNKENQITLELIKEKLKEKEKLLEKLSQNSTTNNQIKNTNVAVSSSFGTKEKITIIIVILIILIILCVLYMVHEKSNIKKLSD